MSANIMQCDYDQLASIARTFQGQAEALGGLLSRVRTEQNRLREGWVGLGSGTFASEMDSAVLPAMGRLVESLHEASRVTAKIGTLLNQAEQKAARPFQVGDSGQAREDAGVAATTKTSDTGREAGNADSSEPAAKQVPAAPPVVLASEKGAVSPMAGRRANLDADFLDRLDNVAARMKAQGYDTKIAWGHRTLADQVMIYTRGRTFEQFKTGILKEVGKKHITVEEAQKWIDYYDPEKGGHPMEQGFKKPVTWTLKSVHLEGKAADVVDPRKGWDMPPAYWKALRKAAEAEGLRIGPPASDSAHVQVNQPRAKQTKK